MNLDAPYWWVPYNEEIDAESKINFQDIMRFGFLMRVSWRIAAFPMNLPGDLSIHDFSETSEGGLSYPKIE